MQNRAALSGSRTHDSVLSACLMRILTSLYCKSMAIARLNTYYDGLQEHYTSSSCASLRNQTVINFPHENKIKQGPRVYINTLFVKDTTLE